MKVSIITPVYNEAKGLSILFEEISAVGRSIGGEYEIIAVDDGSQDNSFDVLRTLAASDKKIKIVRFRANAGQTSAIAAGVAKASGDIIVSLDSDLENDPHDIPKLLKKLDEGYDVVSGWRVTRWEDKPLTRKLPSSVANWLISFVTGVRLHDYGCMLKAYRREFLIDVRLYGEMHRFIPAYASWRGARVTEIPVSHRQRKYGTSHYGISRTFRVLLDLLLVAFLDRFMNRPIHFFGVLCFLSFSGGVLAGGIAIAFKIFEYKDFVETPLPVFSALLVIVGIQLIAIGVVAEIIMRTYYESQGKTPYSIRETVNL